jgi:hypothetical protein
VRTIDKPWVLYDNTEDPFQLHNLIDEPKHQDLAAELESEMRAQMGRIGDRFLSKEEYYKIYEIEIDHRGKVTDIIDNVYDRMG